MTEGRPSPSIGGTVEASAIPVGGGIVLSQLETVLTQPVAGEFHAFTSICTHQGCEVGTIEGDVIECPCHGSQFSATTGEVVRGPAARPLEARAIRVNGPEVVF